MSEKFDCYIGRWSPFHKGHFHIIQQVLDKGGNVLIQIRDTLVSDADPFTATERLEMIVRVYERLIEEGRVRVMIIPDICSVNYGRGVGYEIKEYAVPDEIRDISATTIRESIKNGGEEWKSMVPPAVASYITKLSG